MFLVSYFCYAVLVDEALITLEIIEYLSNFYLYRRIYCLLWVYTLLPI